MIWSTFGFANNVDPVIPRAGRGRGRQGQALCMGASRGPQWARKTNTLLATAAAASQLGKHSQQSMAEASRTSVQQAVPSACSTAATTKPRDANSLQIML